MRKSLFLLGIIALFFVACEPQEKVDFENPDVYGVWVTEDKGYQTSVNQYEDLIYYLNEENTKFISEDSIIVYHGDWAYTKSSDCGRAKYKYEVVKGEKLTLVSYSDFSDTYSTIEFSWRPDLSIAIDSFVNEYCSSKIVSSIS